MTTTVQAATATGIIAMSDDNDLIRRGDALEICTAYGFSRADECRDGIAALPAVSAPVAELVEALRELIAAQDPDAGEMSRKLALKDARAALARIGGSDGQYTMGTRIHHAPAPQKRTAALQSGGVEAAEQASQGYAVTP